MNIFKLTITPTTEGRTLVYDTKIKSYGNLWTTIFTGKVYVLPNQSEVKIDLEDILWNYKFDGTDYFAPKLNTTGDDYEMCYTYTTLDNFWYNEVMVEIPSLNVSTTKNVCFFNSRMFDHPIEIVSDNTAAILMDYQPIAHIPSTTPTGFYYRQLVWDGSFVKNVDGNTVIEQRNKLGQITFTGGNKFYAIGDKKIALIDPCPSPYYLCWMTNCGAMQVQPFTRYSEVEIDYNNNTRADMSNYRWGFNKTVQTKWKLKSKNLSDKDFKAFSQMFNSPYIILLDTVNGRMHFVNIDDETYNQKINKPKEKKIFFEVTVSSCEIKTI